MKRQGIRPSMPLIWSDCHSCTSTEESSTSLPIPSSSIGILTDIDRSMDVGECISFEHYIEHGSELRDSLEAEAQLPSKLPISAIRPAVTDLVSSGFFLLQDLDDICWDAINDPNDPHEFCAAFLQINSGLPMFANGFLACLPGNQFVKHWNSVFLELWKDRTSCVGLRNHPLLDGLPRMDLPDEFKVGLGTTMSPDSINDYVAHIITMTRLISIVDPESGFSGPKYFNTRCRLFRLPSLYPMHEVFLGKEGFSEQRQFEIFQLPRLTNSIEPEQVAAKRFIEGTLTGGILKKLSHGTSTVGCAASYLDEVVDADVRPGTWGEYFRWATVHLVYPHIPEPVIPGGLELARIEQAKVVGIIEEVDFEIAKVIRVD